MSQETDKILKMLEEGTISAEEADALLAAVEEDSEETDVPVNASSAPNRAEVLEAWRLPFNMSLIITALGGSLLWRARRASSLGRALLTILLLPLTLLGALSALFFYLSKNGPWLYLRIRSSEGRRFSFGLPFPLDWASRALSFILAQEPDDEVREKLTMAREFLAAVESSDLQEPVSIDVSDEGGQVEVYLIQ